MSEIFCAMDRVSRRKVVIKKMPLDPLNRSFSLQRYENEARNASLLPHDHIISILDYGEYDDVFYIVMEHVDGINLDQFMSSPAFKSDIGLMIVLTALQALHRAHQNGVIHCDIKPANILISRNGRVIVTDFGLSQAKAHAMDPEQGKHDFTTPLFMPPEQAKVIAEKVGLASDVWEETATVVYNDLSPEQARMLSERGVQWDLWSVGVLLYRMCCGRYPFNGNDLAGLLTSIVHSEATGIHELAADLPKPIASVIERCLEKEPYRRPHSLDPVINALKKHFAAVQSGAMQGMIAAQIQEQLAEGEKPEGSLLRTIRPVVSALPGMTARIVSRIGSKLWRMSTAILRAAGQRSRAEEREKPEGTVPFYAPAMSVLNSRFFKPVIALVGALFLVVIGTLVIKEFPVKDIRSAAVQLTGKKQAGEEKPSLVRPKPRGKTPVPVADAAAGAKSSIRAAPQPPVADGAVSPKPAVSVAPSPRRSIPPAARKTTSPPVARTAREAAPPPAKKPAPVKPQSADGILKVSIDPPSALVFVDGEMVTRREMTNGRRVPAGFHDIVAQAAGHEPYQRSFLMEADKTQMMAISLKPKEKGNGQLHVYSYPWSNLYLDGTLIGTTPTPSPITLTSGEHRIVLRREGFKAHQETVRINKDEVTRIQVQLEKEEPEE